MNTNLYLNPGPRDESLLYLGAEHRARKLFLNPQEGERCTMDFKRGDGSFWELVYDNRITLTGRVLVNIGLFGFGGVIRCGYRKVDRALIEALVERWRPETNTFHLPFGEATVTLEDVNVLWGLPIEGQALTGYESSFEYDERRFMCLTYLGFDTQPTDYKNQLLKLSTMLTFMVNNPITVESTDEECMQRARCICLILATNNVLADTNNGYASLHLLTHLTNYTVSGQLSWGAATLASLYRELYKGTKPQTKAVGGPMSLLQIWAWTRIRTLTPIIVNQQIDWNKPYGARWAEHEISNTETPSHVLKAHRTTLQNLREADFDWMPYRNVMPRLPEMCTTGISSWKSRCFLVYWNIVEYHPVERVMRQFGFLQEVPAPFHFSREVLRILRKTMRKGRLDTSWSVHHAVYVENWNHRHENVVEGVPTNMPTAHPTYNDWFHRHTVLYIKDPRHVRGVVHTGFDDHGGTARYLVDGLGFIGQEAIRMQNMGPDHYYENFAGLQGMASQLIGSVNHIEQPSYIQTHEPDLGPDNTLPQHAPRGRGCRGRRHRGRQRTRVDHVHDDDEGEDPSNFRGPTANYGEGPSNFGGPTPNYGEGPSNFGGLMTVVLVMQKPNLN